MATVTPQRRPSVFNLPNQLTASRLLLSVLLFALIALEHWLGCLVVFALAALTDWLDGYIARRQGLSTSLGRVFDPLVDKVLICGAFIFLLPDGSRPDAGWLTPWMVVVVVAREFLITGLRGYLEAVGVRFGADWLGKLKMGLQCAALVAIFASLYYADSPLFAWTRDGLIWAMLATTILSGLQYLGRGLTIVWADPDKGSI
ncbi:MAG: CDP-diacylglycerol--glycerol-3-phosphate 3-phosphatidyltransferase [Gemmataceae bacterium]